jgi:hypothetical protein
MNQIILPNEIIYYIFSYEPFYMLSRMLILSKDWNIKIKKIIENEFDKHYLTVNVKDRFDGILKQLKYLYLLGGKRLIINDHITDLSTSIHWQGWYRLILDCPDLKSLKFIEYQGSNILWESIKNLKELEELSFISPILEDLDNVLPKLKMIGITDKPHDRKCIQKNFIKVKTFSGSYTKFKQDETEIDIVSNGFHIKTDDSYFRKIDCERLYGNNIRSKIFYLDHITSNINLKNTIKLGFRTTDIEIPDNIKIFVFKYRFDIQNILKYPNIKYIEYGCNKKEIFKFGSLEKIEVLFIKNYGRVNYEEAPNLRTLVFRGNFPLFEAKQNVFELLRKSPKLENIYFFHDDGKYLYYKWDNILNDFKIHFQSYFSEQNPKKYIEIRIVPRNKLKIEDLI